LPVNKRNDWYSCRVDGLLVPKILLVECNRLIRWESADKNGILTRRERDPGSVFGTAQEDAVSLKVTSKIGNAR
jgi:hypothetical protein